MDYREALRYIHSIEWRGSKPGLSRTRDLLHRLGDPHRRMKFVHVAGTNGKGSVCEMISSVLRECGYKVGRIPLRIFFGLMRGYNRKEERFRTTFRQS